MHYPRDKVRIAIVLSRRRMDGIPLLKIEVSIVPQQTSTTQSSDKRLSLPDFIAMATGSDVRDILSLPSTSSARAGPSSAAPTRRPQQSTMPGSKKAKKPRMDGISRELYALLGDNSPGLTLAHGTPGSAGPDASHGAGEGANRFMPKYRKRPQRVQKWVQSSFRNPARRDDLTLSHWIPQAEQRHLEHEAGPSAEEHSQAAPRIYRFADLNTSSGVYAYSNDEYHQHLRDDDWTKEETDHLMDLCHAYDLRFVIIADRFHWPGGRERSMEDLKARYYAICRRLVRSRISTEDVEQRSQLLLTYSFDRNREVERKKHVARLFSRTPQQLAEEEALYVEARRLEQNEAKFAAEREELLRLLGGWERTPNVRSETVAAAGSGVGLVVEPVPEDEASRNKARKRKASEDATANTSTLAGGPIAAATSAAIAAAAGGQTSVANLTPKQRAELKSQQFDETHNISRFDPQAAASTPSKPPYPHLTGTPSTYPPVAPLTSHGAAAASHGAYLRSQRMLAPRGNLLLKTQEALAELVPAVSLRTTFPTRANCEKWEGVVGAVTSGLEMKRQLDRVQSELRVAQMRLQSQTATQGGHANQTSGATPSRQSVGRVTSATPVPGAAARRSSISAAHASVTPAAADGAPASADITRRDSLDDSMTTVPGDESL